MEFQEALKDIIFLFGGTSAVLISLVAFLGHLSSKRIINSDLAKHKIELENLKSENKILQDGMKNELTKDLRNLESSNTQLLESIKQEHELRIEIQQAESNNILEKVKNEMNTSFLKSETYTSISQEMYQELYNKRINAYALLLDVKNEIDKSIIDNAEMLEFQEEDPSHFIGVIHKVNEAFQSKLMLISNELATISNELYKKSSRVFINAKVKVFHAENSTYDGGSKQSITQEVIDVEDNELRKMLTECGGIYDQWVSQLEKDTSEIRMILDISGRFLKSEH